VVHHNSDRLAALETLGANVVQRGHRFAASPGGGLG
jgi:hypothetical protein